MLDVIDRKACIVLLREGALKNDEEQLVTGFFFRCGVMFVKYKQVAEINWCELMINTLIFAAVNHALSSQIVEAMRDRQISFSSDYVLSWGRGHETFFKRAGHLGAGVTTKIGNVSSEFIAAGSPKFYDSLISPNVDVLRWRLGIEQQKFSKIVLVGTNLSGQPIKFQSVK